ncbi:MAG: hypothetical protein JNL11_10860 [Bdellovibrionaceae bacterium]|nr:hypothetical protein [Pseudobdellovibrionaceae bacterium]
MNAAPRYQRHWGFTSEESLEFEALAKDVNGEFRGWEETKAFSPGALPEGGYGYNISIKGKNTLVKGLVVPKNLGLKPDFSKKLKRYLTMWERLNNVGSQTQTDFILLEHQLPKMVVFIQLFREKMGIAIVHLLLPLQEPTKQCLPQQKKMKESYQFRFSN